tara:strand:- start:174 stop:596 length:423 start_codon:yes stop_codon:yes gene_type:complete
MVSTGIQLFVQKYHNGVLSTRRKSGTSQLSIVTVGLVEGNICFSTTQARSKYFNLLRDPDCSLLVSKDDWWEYIVIEGKAKIMGAFNTRSEDLRLLHRQVYAQTAGHDHPDWVEFDKAMVNDGRVVVFVEPQSIYGTVSG